MVLNRPILVGGVSLSATLWLLDMVHISVFDSSTLLSAMALGTGLWWWRRRDRPVAPARPIAPPVVDHARVERELSALQALIETLTTETEATPALASGGTPSALVSVPYEQQRQTLLADLDRQRLRVAVVGDRRTGKTTLIELLTARSESADLSSPDFQEIAVGAETPMPKDWSSVDALVWIADGDITDSTFTLLKEGLIAGQGVVLVFNKADYYDPAVQQTILTQLQQRAAAWPAPVPVVQTMAAPRPIKVRRHEADGTVTEWLEATAPVIAPLEDAITHTLVAQTATLVAATTLRQTATLRHQVQTDLNQVRRQRAMPLVDQLQWVAAATAFANPVPTLDLLATVAINGQLMMDLGQIYGFKLSLEEAKTAAASLASLVVKLGLVELSTQALTAVLKSHFATYLAGGMVQGLSAAYLTRMAGLSLIDYFEQAALAGTPTQALSWEALGQRLQAAIQTNRQASLLQTLVKQGISILKPSDRPAPLPAATTPAVALATPAPEAEPLTLDTDSIPA